MTPQEKAADKLGDMMKLLAQGCHVKVGKFVFKLEQHDHVMHMKYQWAEYYPSMHWALSYRNISDWIDELVNHNIEVLYHPATKKEPPKKQVRKVEL